MYNTGLYHIVLLNCFGITERSGYCFTNQLTQYLKTRQEIKD